MAVQGVIFPALSKINGNDAKFAESYRQITMVVSYAMFPMMLGLSAVAPDLFALLGEKWMPTVPYFEAICLVGLFYPLAMISLNVLKVRSDGRIILRIEVLKKVIMTVIFALTIPRSVMAVVWGLVAISVCEAVVNFAASRRFTSYGWGGFVRTLLPVAAVSGGRDGGGGRPCGGLGGDVRRGAARGRRSAGRSAAAADGRGGGGCGDLRGAVGTLPPRGLCRGAGHPEETGRPKVGDLSFF